MIEVRTRMWGYELYSTLFKAQVCSRYMVALVGSNAIVWVCLYCEFGYSEGSNEDAPYGTDYCPDCRGEW